MVSSCGVSPDKGFPAKGSSAFGYSPDNCREFSYNPHKWVLIKVLGQNL